MGNNNFKIGDDGTIILPADKHTKWEKISLIIAGVLFAINLFLFINSLGAFVVPKTIDRSNDYRDYYVAETPLLKAPCLRGISHNSTQEAVMELQSQAYSWMFIAIIGCIAFLCFYVVRKKQNKMGSIIAFVSLVLFTIILLSKFEC